MNVGMGIAMLLTMLFCLGMNATASLRASH